MEETRPAWAEKLSKIFCIPQRVILSFMLLFGIITAFTMRACLSMAITRIVIKRDTASEVESGAICPKEEDDEKWEGGDQEWDQILQGWAMSSFYIGYIVSHLPGGMLADKFGGKYVLSIGNLLSAAGTLLTPITIEKTGAVGTIFLRIVMGVGQGTLFPAVSTILAKWIPKSEMSLIGAMVLGGSILGTVASNYVSGWILAHYRWPTVFYVMGFGGLFWFILFTILCYSNPLEHPFISTKERAYLLQELGSFGTKKDLPMTPFNDIVHSAPFMSMLLAQLGHDWGFYVLITDLPKYMHDVLQFSIQNNGRYTALSFLGMYICLSIMGFVADLIIVKGYLTTSASRKLNTCLGAIMPGFFMVAASYAGCDRQLVVILFVLCLTSMGPFYVGVRLNPIDMSPNYAGSLMAIVNGFSAITGVMAPPIIGMMTPETTIEQWRMVFWLTFFILTSTLVCYVIWGTSDIQPWNDGPVRKGRSQEAAK